MFFDLLEFTTLDGNDFLVGSQPVVIFFKAVESGLGSIKVKQGLFSFMIQGCNTCNINSAATLLALLDWLGLGRNR